MRFNTGNYVLFFKTLLSHFRLHQYCHNGHAVLNELEYFQELRPKQCQQKGKLDGNFSNKLAVVVEVLASHGS